MPKALGLIETRGLVAAIEAADAMVKAANVQIVGKEVTKPALITIKIVGDVAAVKSAVDAGAAAAQKVGEVVSIHVIPQPDSQMITMFPELDDDYSPVNDSYEQEISENIEIIEEQIEKPSMENFQQVVTPEITPNVPQMEGIPNVPKEVTAKVPQKEVTARVQSKVKKSEPDAKPDANAIGNLFTIHNDTISRLRQEALGKANLAKKKASDELEAKHPIQPPKEETNISLPDDIGSLNVHQLRRLARDTENFPIKGREISKANRQELIEFFKQNS
jgi:microcompartment protein CcmL/EutN